VREGEFFSLLGPSGCGKTTTLRCVAGFEALSAGSIRLGGERLDDKPPHRRDVGLVFQNYALFPHLTIFENIAFGLRLRRLPTKEVGRRVGRMLELVELPEIAERYPAQLSGGQQQRIAIARSLVLEPRILMFDEPLSNLDFKLRIQMRDELRALQRRLGKTSIYVTHDQTEALALSDRIAVLSHGHIEQIGAPDEIYEKPATVFVADFIGSSNLFRARIADSTGRHTIVETEEGLRLTCAADGETPGRGLQVSVLVRPERISVHAPGSGVAAEPNRFSARIADVSYLGEDLQLVLELAGGRRLRASLKNDGSARRFAQGRSVEIAVASADLRILRK
jgi:spermidine/putrescine ABC transporter ATP-binding subunit